MKQGRGDKHQAVETIQQSAMTGDGMADVLDSKVPLDRRQQQIAELPKYAEPRAENQQPVQSIDGRTHKEKMSQRCHESGGQHKGSDAARPGLARLVLGSTLGPPTSLPTQNAKMSFSSTPRNNRMSISRNRGLLAK